MPRLEVDPPTRSVVALGGRSRGAVTEGPVLSVVLAVLFVGLLGYVAVAPARPASLIAADVPPGTTGLFGAERANGLDFRWTRPDASVPLTAAMPGSYRVVHTMFNGAPPSGSRPVEVTLNGRVAGTVFPTAVAQPYSFPVSLPVESWRPSWTGEVTVGHRIAPYTPPSDPRVLGIALTSIELQPVGPPWSLVARLLTFYTALLAILIVVTRLWHMAAPALNMVLGLAVLVVTAAAVVSRDSTVFWLAQPTIEPLWVFGAMLLAAPGAVLYGLLAPRVAGATVRRTVGGSPNPLEARVRGHYRVAVAALTVGALALRLWRLDQLSLWLDEGFTVMYSRLPWSELLGLRGQYDVHPPLYYALVKLVSGWLPDATAGRTVSAVSGALLVPVAYRLARLVIDPRAAVVAAAVVAIAPLHVWYSREARMYALALLAVGNFLPGAA